ncbi:MAG: UDP-N-acetylmuramoyl-L-alanyl-D-glutamate--2,6-diaminopimelate ligase [Candidatus Brocadiia bacterium]|jgi:UDP-N-acetylmuramoyl-L-alanyl-D-glutamate--2,6-diaminopimelate ligase|nr:UDP-N-acetylmuramoyl-L-alanyl-D-glutamate--2,6-diaminopimelate ligase [Candidatus Brocadiia bacterium]
MNRDGKSKTDSIALGELTGALQTVETAPRHCAHWRDVQVLCVTDDSRLVEPGEGALFVAVRGEQADGHGFIPEALARGACAVVCEQRAAPVGAPSPLPERPAIRVQDSRRALSALAAAFNGRPADALCMVGVTGTDGKTTTTELCRAILNEAGLKVGSLGTVKYNFAAHAVDSPQTTPHPLALHAMLREMVQEGLTHVCMEVSSHAIVQQRTADVPFDVAVLTNVTEDHLDYHRTPEAYVLAKQRLFEGLDETATAVLNAASPICERFAAACPGRVLTYGLDRPADVTGRKRSENMRGMDILVETPAGAYELQTPLTGDYNAENLLAAAVAAFALGIDEETVRRAVRGFAGVAGRLELIEAPPGLGLPGIFVDYAHTPNALRSVLESLRSLTPGRLICVFGCGGDREKQKRPLMGAASAELADLTVLTSDNSRSEATEQIIAEIAQGIADYIAEPDRRRAIEKAIDLADSPQDVVAICGRGCERVQDLGERRLPFDDRVVAREIVGAISAKQRRSA